ncbi:MAG: hypothetical protein ACPGU5_03305 [Lishizhenia sp.]
MSDNTQKPTKEAKALSLFLMAFKSKKSIYKEKLKRINRVWNLVRNDEFPNEEYQKEVNELLTEYGGYDAVVEKTVQHYINTTGEWKLNGEDQYHADAQKVADKIYDLRSSKK